MLATVSFGDTLLDILELALLFLWIWIAVGVVFDIFRSRDLSNGAKALWVLFIIVLPYIGVLAYLLVRGHTLHEHQVQDRTQYEAFQRFAQSGAASAATPTGAADIETLADLRDRGVLTPDEFERAKARTAP